ncbi:TPA: response regulator transcription factor [Klebsiella aerogenes]|nr:response regulator transcription factor [Klebsiella aerogenes]HEJ0416107.1 response regulator transcription factor [Klebsiella aerogenes]
MQIKNWGEIGYYENLGCTYASNGRSTLTENEINVLELMAREYSISEIAEELDKSIKTVYTQKAAAMRKLRLKNSHELRLFIIRHRRMLTLF